MRIYGIDFTSRPRRSKPITCLECVLEDDRLHAGVLNEWQSFNAFEETLQQPGPWIAGIDFPFGQSRTFIENIGWPATWPGYVSHVKALGREGFRAALDNYRANRQPGDREHRRATDITAGSISPQKLYGVPVGLMFFEGAPRLLEAGVTIPGLIYGDPDRIVVEVYPGLLARALIGRRSYKHDTKSKQTPGQYAACRVLLQKIENGALTSSYGLYIEAPMPLADDPTGDHIDALLCAIQAAWALTQRDNGFGTPKATDPLEGWIAAPLLANSAAEHR